MSCNFSFKHKLHFAAPLWYAEARLKMAQLTVKLRYVYIYIFTYETIDGFIVLNDNFGEERLCDRAIFIYVYRCAYFYIYIYRGCSKKVAIIKNIVNLV